MHPDSHRTAGRAVRVLSVRMLSIFVLIFPNMKKILLVGKLLTNIPPADQLTIKDAEYFAAPGLAEVQQIFEKNNNAIDIVIMGAGIELDKVLRDQQLTHFANALTA